MSIKDTYEALKKAVKNEKLVGPFALCQRVFETDSLESRSWESLQKLLRYTIQPIYLQFPRHSLRFTATIVASLWKNESRYTVQVSRKLINDILSGVMDFVEAHPTNANKTEIGSAFYSLLCKFHFSSPKNDLDVNLRATIYILLNETITSHLPNQKKLRDAKVLGGKRLGATLAQTFDFLAIEGLVEFIANLLPPPGESRERFIETVFDRSLFSNGDILKNILLSTTAETWDETFRAIISSLATSNIAYPQPFQTSLIAVSETTISADRFYVDKSGLIANIEQSDGVESFEVSFSSIQSIGLSSSPTSTSLKVVLKTPPLVGVKPMPFLHGEMIVLDITLSVADQQNIVASLQARNMLVEMTKRKVSVPDQQLTFNFSPPQKTFPEKAQNFQFEPTSPSVSAVDLPVEGRPVGAELDLCSSDGIDYPKITHEPSSDNVQAKPKAEGLDIAPELEPNEDKGPFLSGQEGAEPRIDFKKCDPRHDLTASYSETLYQEEENSGSNATHKRKRDVNLTDADSGMDPQHSEHSQTRQATDFSLGHKPRDVFKKSPNATKRYGKKIRTSSPDVDHYDQIPLPSKTLTPRRAGISTRMKDKAGRKTRGSSRRAPVSEGKVATVAAVDQEVITPLTMEKRKALSAETKRVTRSSARTGLSSRLQSKIESHNEDQNAKPNGGETVTVKPTPKPKKAPWENMHLRKGSEDQPKNAIAPIKMPAITSDDSVFGTSPLSNHCMSDEETIFKYTDSIEPLKMDSSSDEGLKMLDSTAPNKAKTTSVDLGTSRKESSSLPQIRTPSISQALLMRKEITPQEDTTMVDLTVTKASVDYPTSPRQSDTESRNTWATPTQAHNIPFSTQLMEENIPPIDIPPSEKKTISVAFDTDVTENVTATEPIGVTNSRPQGRAYSEEGDSSSSAPEFIVSNSKAKASSRSPLYNLQATATVDHFPAVETHGSQTALSAHTKEQLGLSDIADDHLSNSQKDNILAGRSLSTHETRISSAFTSDGRFMSRFSPRISVASLSPMPMSTPVAKNDRRVQFVVEGSGSRYNLPAHPRFPDAKTSAFNPSIPQQDQDRLMPIASPTMTSRMRPTTQGATSPNIFGRTDMGYLPRLTYRRTHQPKDSTFHKPDYGRVKVVRNTRFEEVIIELNKALVDKISQGLLDVKKGVRIGTQHLLSNISADIEEMGLESSRYYDSFKDFQTHYSTYRHEVVGGLDDMLQANTELLSQIDSIILHHDRRSLCNMFPASFLPIPELISKPSEGL